jgi:hypothetical protein
MNCDSLANTELLQITIKMTAPPPPSTMEGRSCGTIAEVHPLPSPFSENGPSSPQPPFERPRGLDNHASLVFATNMVHSLFGVNFGPCWGDFFCSHGRIRGRLYAVTNGILFYSNLLGFERRLCLQFTDVTSIALHRTTSIRIEVADYDAYIFRSFHNREQVLQLLIRLKQLVDKKRSRASNHTTPTNDDETERYGIDRFEQWEKRQIEYENEWRNNEVHTESDQSVPGLHTSFSSSNVHHSFVGSLMLPNRRRALSDSVVRSPDIQVTPPDVCNINPFSELPDNNLQESWIATSRKMLSLDEVGIAVRMKTIVLAILRRTRQRI